MASQPTIGSRPNLGAAVQLLAAAQLPTEDLTAAHCEHFFLAGSPTEPTGLVGLELFGNVALLRSLVVARDRRGTGEGAALLRHAEDHARTRRWHAVSPYHHGRIFLLEARLPACSAGFRSPRHTRHARIRRYLPGESGIHDAPTFVNGGVP
jgi:GNAT superfamily N-acetyltransferase